MVTEVDFVTFIIPSIGRSSLKRAVESVINQGDWNWKIIIVFDGIEPNIDFNNDHIKYITAPKTNSAGLTRNIAIPLVDTGWTAFLDDDDYIADTYIQKLKYYINEDSERDIIIFTYRDITNGNTRPPLGFKDIVSCEVGISFACKTDFIHHNDIKFQWGAIEDFAFLNDCRNAGAKYYLTNDVQYYVGGIGGNQSR